MNKHVGSAIDPSWSDPDEAVAFLKALRPDGPWNLTAIAPDKHGAESATFVEPTKARKWLAERVGRANLYYMPNPAPSPTGALGRAVKADVINTEFRHVDIDLDKLPVGHEWFDLDLAARKATMLEKLRTLDEPGPPSFVVDTGGGLQALWWLSHPEPVSSDLYEDRQNAHLIELLGGDSGTHNIDRLLRLPFTVNLPDKQKRQRGRLPAPARVVLESDRRYWAFEFAMVASQPTKTDAVGEIGPPEFVDDFEEFALKHSLSDRTRTIIADGHLEEPKSRDNSRSAWVFDCAVSLVRAGVPPEQIVGVLLDDRWVISESLLEKGGHNGERAARRTVQNAIAAVRSEAHALDDEPLEEMDETAELAPTTRRSRFTPLEIEDMENLPIPEWLVEGWVTEFALGQVYGPRKKGKTFAVLDMALHVALGWDWCGHQVKRKRVKYVVGEGSIGRFFDRVRAWCLEHKIDPHDLSGWFSVVSVRVGVDNDKDLQEFFAADHTDVGVVVIDTVARNMDGDENATKDMNLFVKGADRIREHYHCAVILVHHSGKDEGKAGRGSTVLPGAVDCTIRVSNSSTGLVLVRLEECRDGPAGEELAFEMKPQIVDDEDLRSSIALRAKSVDVSLEDEVKSIRADEPRGRCLIKIAESRGVQTRAELVDERAKGMSRANVQKIVVWLAAHRLVVAPGEGPITATDAGVERALALGAKIKA